jgi:hypothetical protein
VTSGTVKPGSPKFFKNIQKSIDMLSPFWVKRAFLSQNQPKKPRETNSKN